MSSSEQRWSAFTHALHPTKPKPLLLATLPPIEFIDLPPDIRHRFLSRKASVLPRLKLRPLLFNECFGLLRGSEYSNDCSGVRMLRFDLGYNKHRQIEIVQRVVSRTS